MVIVPKSKHPIFQCTNLTYQINGYDILTDVNLTIPRDKLVGIVGPNGAGKTSLLKHLQGRVSPTSGQVLCDNENVANLSLQQRAQKIAFVSQHNPLVFELPVIDVVKSGRLPYSKFFSFSSTQKENHLVEKALRKFELWDKRFQSFDSLSGGEQQRGYLAQAFVQNAEVLLLDEPINHLDIKHQLSILEELKKRTQATILTLHDLNLALSFCEHLIILHQGKVLAAGEPELVLSKENIAKAFGVSATTFTMSESDSASDMHNGLSTQDRVDVKPKAKVLSYQLLETPHP